MLERTEALELAHESGSTVSTVTEVWRAARERWLLYKVGRDEWVDPFPELKEDPRAALTRFFKESAR